MFSFDKTLKHNVFKTYSKQEKYILSRVILEDESRDIFLMSYLQIPFVSLQEIISSWYLSLSEEVQKEFL
jgi:hypothetical protein